MLYDSDERSEYMSAASAASLLNERGYANVYVHFDWSYFQVRMRSIMKVRPKLIVILSMSLMFPL